MKKFLIVSGILFWLLVVTVAFLGWRMWEFNVSSKEFMDKKISAIISTWSKQELLDCASQNLKNNYSTNRLNIDRAWMHFEDLGALKKYYGSNKKAFPITNKAKQIMAKYVAEADFQNGSSEITVILTQENGGWKIDGFNLQNK